LCTIRSASVFTRQYTSASMAARASTVMASTVEAFRAALRLYVVDFRRPPDSAAVAGSAVEQGRSLQQTSVRCGR